MLLLRSDGIDIHKERNVEIGFEIIDISYKVNHVMIAVLQVISGKNVLKIIEA